VNQIAECCSVHGLEGAAGGGNSQPDLAHALEHDARSRWRRCDGHARLQGRGDPGDGLAGAHGADQDGYVTWWDQNLFDMAYASSLTGQPITVDYGAPNPDSAMP
jgi:hypothetical protein